MAHCPSCKAQIDHLDMTTDERHYFTARLAKEGDAENAEVVDYGDDISVTEEGDTKLIDGDFSCPECNAEVANSPMYASEILKGD